MIVGLMFSPATAIRNLKVVGSWSNDQTRISREAQFLSSVPCFRVDKAKFEEKLMFPSEVRAAELHRNIFGRGTAVLSYRKPVAKVERAYLDEGGVLFTTQREFEELPTVRFVAGPSFGLALGSTLPLKALAGVAREMSQREALRKAEIELRSDASVCLNLEDSVHIEMGPLERLDDKFKTFDGLLASNPNLLIEAKTLILIAPDQPAIKKKSQ
jgi:hypothetical protein